MVKRGKPQGLVNAYGSKRLDGQLRLDGSSREGRLWVACVYKHTIRLSICKNTLTPLTTFTSPRSQAR